MRAGICVRVSMREQIEGYSLDAQEQACRQLAKERGYQIANVYRDEGLSGKTTERPAFQAMMRDAEAGKLDVVLVHKLDRFSRSVVDVLLSLQDLEERGVSFVSVTENFDFTTPVGRVTLTVLSAIAEWYLGNLGAETAKGKKARAEAGLWNSDIPFGYAVDYKKDGGDGIPYPDEDNAQGVRLAFESYATGQYSDADIARILNEAGYRPQGRGDRALALFSKDSVRDLLRNRFLLGEVQYKGEWFPGQHEPIIPEKLFDRCQAARKRRRRKVGTTARADSRVYALSGLARCARCGWPMRGSSSKKYRYFRLIDKEAGRGKDILSDRTRIHGQLERLKRLFVLGDLTEREYTVERDRLEAQLAGLIPPVMPDLQQAAQLLQNIGSVLDAATAEERRESMQILLEAVYLDSQERPAIAIEPKAEYRALFDMVEIVEPPDPEDDSGGGMSHGGSEPVAPVST